LAWIAHVKNHSLFLVDGDASGTLPSAESKAKRRVNYVRGPQPTKCRAPKDVRIVERMWSPAGVDGERKGPRRILD
jgi:hypothetical protein